MGWIADIFKEIPLSVNLQAKLDTLEEKFAVLELRNKYLESENNKFREEIQRRDNILQKEKSHDNLLDETKVNILLLLSKHENLIDEQIARSLNLNLQVAKYHLQELDDKKMIGCLLTVNSPIQWYLNHEGRHYLIKHKLIS